MAITISGGSAGTTIIEGNDGGAQLNNATGAFTIPVGTTAQRPATPAKGMLRLNTDINNNVEVYNGTAFVTVGLQNDFLADLLVIGGGGGGGTYYGGGGGAGGYLEFTSQSLAVGTAYTVTVAGGANGSSSRFSKGDTASGSVFGTITAAGGGGGGSDSNKVGADGGSGVVILKYPDIFTISNPGGGLTLSTATAGGFSVTTVTAGTGNVSFA